MAHIFSVIVDYFLSKTMKSASSNLILYTAKVAVDGCRIKVIYPDSQYGTFYREILYRAD